MMEPITTETFTQEEETILLEHSRKGDARAYNQLVGMHWQPIVNLGYRMCGDIDQAEDIAQETFIRAWQKIHTYRPQSSFRSWLYRIATNLAVDKFRRESGKYESLDGDSALSTDKKPEVLFLDMELGEQVQRAVLALPPASRIVLVLREYEELSYHEISETLDIPVGTVMSRLNYARANLRHSLKDLLVSKEEV